MANNKKRSPGLLSFIVWLLLLSIILIATARSEDRALLIGVGRYAHFDERLNGVSLDITMMREFVHLMGFKGHEIKVLEHEHASTAKVYSAIENWLINGTGPNDRVLFYFSGHGSQIPDENNDEEDQFDEVLLLYDADLKESNGRQTLSGVLIDDHLSLMLAKMRSRNILVVLDACHSGSATKRMQLSSRSFRVDQSKAKYFYYSPSLEAAGGSGSFDLMKPQVPSGDGSRYVAITACRDDEKTVATAQGSIFTLGLRQTLRSAAAAGTSITPEELQIGTEKFIRKQIQSDVAAFHPQIAGNMLLRKRPLALVSSGGSYGFVRQKLESLVHKSNETVWIKLNKTCFEPGETLELSVWIPEPGFLNILYIDVDDQATVLFPNRYHPHNAVERGKIILPDKRMDFEMVTEGPPGVHLITAFLTRSPLNGYQDGFKTAKGVLAELSPNSTRSLVLRQGSGWLAAGKVAAEIRQSGHCRLE
jgi:metacaspase-1